MHSWTYNNKGGFSSKYDTNKKYGYYVDKMEQRYVVRKWNSQCDHILWCYLLFMCVNKEKTDYGVPNIYID